MSSNKYELLKDDTKILNGGTTIYRIKALRDIPILGIKIGDLGGFVEKESNLSQYGDCWIFNNAIVYGNAYVCGDARIYGFAKIYGCCLVYGNAIIYGDVELYKGIKIGKDAYIESDNDYAMVSCFGRYNRTTVFYLTKDKSIMVVCGCFEGSIDEFRDEVKTTHGDSDMGKEYLDIADLMERRFKRILETKMD